MRRGGGGGGGGRGEEKGEEGEERGRGGEGGKRGRNLFVHDSNVDSVSVLTHDSSAAIEHNSKHLLEVQNTRNIGVVLGVVALPM